VFATLLAQSSSGDAAAAGISIVIILLSLVISIGLLVFHIYVLVDLLKYSDGVWLASGQNKTTWIVLWVVSWCCGLTLILDLVYWFAIRPKLQAAESTGGGGYPTYPS
jgi:hypothetical protein